MCGDDSVAAAASASAPSGDKRWEDGECLDADSDAEDRLDEDEDACECLVLGLRCSTVVMFLMRTMVRAAPQSTKAKVAPFHNFILEHGGALKFCGEKGDRQPGVR